MTRFRYRTLALVGPWRETRQAALDDAVRAGQAIPQAAEPAWRCRGWIERSGAPLIAGSEKEI